MFRLSIESSHPEQDFDIFPDNVFSATVWVIPLISIFFYCSIRCCQFSIRHYIVVPKFKESCVKWSNGLVVKALVQLFYVQNHWVAPISTQPFILSRSIKWVPRISEDLLVKSKLSPCSGPVAARQLKPIQKKRP